MRWSFLVAAVLALGLMCGRAVADPIWFPGYQNPSNNYRFFAHTDWDSSLFSPGIGINPDTSVFGIAAPAHTVDGHVTWEALGDGNAKVVDSTGDFPAYAGFAVGDQWTMTALFGQIASDPFYHNAIPQSDTRDDFNSDFVNVLSSPIGASAAPLPSVAAAGALLIGGTGLNKLRRRRQIA